MKDRRSLLFWGIGAAIILIVLYFFVLRYPGYIFYFDSSGSFNYNRPFDQYLFTYTPYDGTEVAIKDRLPIMSVMAGLYYLVAPLFHLSPHDLIKIAFVLLFLGAYTAYFIVFPRFYALFRREALPSDAVHSVKGQVVRIIVSLLYLLVPYFVFRLTMVHMFYFTTFYPLIIYVFLQLCEKKNFSWRSILLLVILCFFGFSYTNILTYYLLTFILFGIAALVSKKSKLERIVLLKNISIAGILIVATNIYWMVPYFLKGTPEPGYTITTSMVNALGSKSTFQNVLLDTSEWFVGQSEKAVVFLSQNKFLLAIQILGAINIYVFSLFAIGTNKQKSYTAAAVLMILLAFLITVKESPIYQYFYNTVVYLDFGWLIREPNRQRFFIAFWTFLLSGIGVAGLILNKKSRDENQTPSYLGIAVVIAFISYLVYVIPWAYTTLTFLKPTPIPTGLREVNNVLANDKEYSFVNALPSLELYRSKWGEPKFYMADSWNYRMNFYSLKRPPLQLNTAVPVSRSKESLITEMLFWEANPSQTAKVLSYLGVKYTLVDHDAVPLFVKEDANKKLYMDPITKEFEDKKSWQSILEKDGYTLGVNKEYKLGDSVGLSNTNLVTAEPLSILNSIDIDTLKGKNLDFLFYDKDALDQNDQIITTSDNAYYYLDYLTSIERTKYSSYPFDYTKEYGVPVDGWGRASAKDKGGAEFTSLLRYHGVRAYQFVAEDKIAYFDTEKDSQVSTLKYTVKTACETGCSVFAKLLYSAESEDVTIGINGLSKKIVTKTNNKEGFYWTNILSGINLPNSTAEVSLTSDKGLNAVASILIVPNSFGDSVAARTQQHTVYKITAGNLYKFPQPNGQCEIIDTKYTDAFIPHVSVTGACPTPMSLRLKQFQSEFMYVDKLTGKMKFASSVPVNGYFEGEIWFFSHVDVILWVLFILTYAAIIIFAELIVLKHVQ